MTPARLVSPTVVALFSVTCTRCPGHVPEVVDYLLARRLPRDQILVVVVGEGDGATRFVEAFDELATVVVEPVDGSFSTAFAIRVFPAFYLLGSDATVTAGADTVAELAPVSA